jgi:Ig-like domain from next to BRCA1 gene
MADRRLLLFGILGILGVVLLIILIFSGVQLVNNLGQPTASPTPNTTQAYQTVAAKLTEAPSLTPAIVPSLIPTEGGVPTQTSTPTPSASPTPAPGTFSPTPPCDRAAAGNPIDITVPDDTVFGPGEPFTKKWSLVNTGTCNWDPKYAAAWFSGEMMGAPSTVPIGVLVPPGNSVVVSVDMVAPIDPGTYQSNWKMQNNGGTLFGIGPGGDSPFWVRIIVQAAPSETPEPTQLPSPTPTPTSTPNVLVSGPALLVPEDLIDLDTLQINPGSGSDMGYQPGEDGSNWLAPQPGALLGVFGISQPSPAECQNTGLNVSPLPVESLPARTYLCYQTDSGHYGWILLSGQNPDDSSINLQVLTWAQP